MHESTIPKRLRRVEKCTMYRGFRCLRRSRDGDDGVPMVEVVFCYWVKVEHHIERLFLR